MCCRLIRSPALVGLVLVMLSAGHCKERSKSSAGLKERQNLLNLIMEIIQELRKYHLEDDEENGVQYKQDFLLDRREVPDYGTYSEEQRVEIVPRDLRMKDKFLNHLTGHLYFGPKCTKHFHRLYHHTRDCTIPAYATTIKRKNCNQEPREVPWKPTGKLNLPSL
ncbi:ALK and LTK ligand 2 isoform X1 [Rhineura floridana]|uniref:ALK and LTK ligand 2 isoform X1 n=1 Tax=Rhineura floridana TaxID=261503 RepID=UPI002AC7E8BC|nr:ALK and LTK ligand 2 isoform X1 [Rhineura floridana]